MQTSAPIPCIGDAGSSATAHGHHHQLDSLPPPPPPPPGPPGPPEAQFPKHKPHHESGFLPTEILLKIVQYALGSPGCRVKWQYALTDEYRFHYPHMQLTPNEIARSACTLCPLLNLRNWSLVNRHWNSVVTPFLYSEIDIHTLAIPGHVVNRPVLFRREVLPSATEEVATSITCVLAEATDSDRIGQVLPVPKYGQYATLRTRRLETDRDQASLSESILRWQLWNKTVALEDQEYLVEFEHAPGEFELENDPGAEHDFMTYKTNTVSCYAPIRTPSDCCFPNHHHHNYTPEWWDLVRIWEDPTEHNPITEYILNRVLVPLVRTLSDRPDLARAVRKIQLPLVVYQDYIVMSSQDDLPVKKRPLTLAGSDVTKPEEQRLRLREAKRMGQDEQPPAAVTLHSLLQSTLQLIQLCCQLESLDGYWSIDIMSLHQRRRKFEQERLLQPPVKSNNSQESSASQYGSHGALDSRHGGGGPGLVVRRRANLMSRVLSRIIHRKSSRNKLVANDSSAGVGGGSSSGNLEADDQSAPQTNTTSATSCLEGGDSDSQGTGVGASHDMMQMDHSNNSQSFTPSLLWSNIYLNAFERLKSWRLEFGSPLSMSLADCSWVAHCGSDPHLELCGKHYWHRYNDAMTRKFFLTTLCMNPPIFSLLSQPNCLENIVQLEFSTIEEEEIQHTDGVLVGARCGFAKAMESGLRNLRRLSVMGSFISLLSAVRDNQLESLQVSRWHIHALHVDLVLEYLARSYHSLDDKAEAALRSLTIDTVSAKLGTAYWAGEGSGPFDITNFPIRNVTLPCGAERQVFKYGDRYEQYFLKLEVVYAIIRYAPNLQELVLRRGRLALDEDWKLELEAKYMRWDLQRYNQPPEPNTNMAEFHPPVARNLKTLAFLVWGKALRAWLLQTLVHDGVFPGLEKMTYASAESEHRRRQWTRRYIAGGPRNSIFAPVDEVETLAEAQAMDQLITQTLRRQRRVSVWEDTVMEGWGKFPPPHTALAHISRLGEGPGFANYRDTRSHKQMWNQFYGEIRHFWMFSWGVPLEDMQTMIPRWPSL